MKLKIERCPRCWGAKRIVGHGMMEMDCPECFGKGIIEIEEKPPEVKEKVFDAEPTVAEFTHEIIEVPEELKIKKKPGKKSGAKYAPAKRDDL